MGDTAVKLEAVKSIFLKVLIGCLIAAGAVAVITVLVGQFNDVAAKALWSIALIAIHSLVSFSFISNNQKQETFENLVFFTNATFVLIVLSFITSIFGLWHILPGDMVGKLYQLYVVLLFAVLHGEVLAKTLSKEERIDKIVYVNFCFMAVVVLLLMPVIFARDSGILSAFYYRLLAAIGIIDATLTLIAIILNKLYVQKHPTIADPVFNLPAQPGQTAGSNAPANPQQQPQHHTNIFVVILVVFLAFQFVGGFIMFALSALWSR